MKSIAIFYFFPGSEGGLLESILPAFVRELIPDDKRRIAQQSAWRHTAWLCSTIA
jgi:hypothetical protein